MVTEAPLAAVAGQPAPAPQPAPPPVAPSAPAQAVAPVYAEETAAPPPAPVAQTVYAQPVTQVTQNYFLSALSPYGAWVEIPSYGWCWQPTVAVGDPYWRPYCHGGRWLYTDCGWYWQSSYSWGWAPFHYGSWYRGPACGWVWVPGSTWSPAWVTWRYTDAYCGWAPLPPGCGWGAGVGLTYYGSGVSVGFSFGLGWDYFSFVHYGRFCDPHPYRHCLPRHEATVVYNHSTVNNHYTHGDHNTIVNHGIAPSRISAVTRSEIHKVPIRDVTGEPDAPRRGDRLERDGRQLAVYRPQPSVSAPPQSTPASRQTQGVRKPITPERSGNPSNVADAPVRGGAPLSSGGTRAENSRPTRTAAPASSTPVSPAAASSPARVTQPTPSRTGAPASGSTSRSETAPPGTATPAGPTGQPAPSVARPPQSTSAPARTVSPNQPNRVERVPASRAATPPTAVPSGSSRTSTPATRPTPSSAAPSRSGSVSPAPTYAPSSVTPATTSRSTTGSRTSTESSRSEPRRPRSGGAQLGARAQTQLRRKVCLWLGECAGFCPRCAAECHAVRPDLSNTLPGDHPNQSLGTG